MLSSCGLTPDFKISGQKSQDINKQPINSPDYCRKTNIALKLN